MEQEEIKIPQIKVQEPLPNCPVPPPCPVVPKSKPGPVVLRIFLVFILALVLAFVILAASGLRIVRKESLLDIWLSSRKPMPIPAPTLILKPTPTPDPTADWKTYTNNGFSFKYPSDYFKFQQEFDMGIYLAPSAGQGGNGPKFLPEGSVWLQVEAEPNMSPSSLEDFMSSKYEEAFYTNAQKTPTIIGGTNGYKVIYDFAAVAGNVRIYNYEGLALKNGRLFKITLSAWDKSSLQKYEKTFDQILSTFKFFPSTSPSPSPSQGTPVKIKSFSLVSPTKGPLVIKGTVESGWMSEGSFLVKLLDASRQEIASASAKETISGSWQSGKAVEFSVSLTFTTESNSGFLVFRNDNPSGLPENAKSFEIPVKFK